MSFKYGKTADLWGHKSKYYILGGVILEGRRDPHGLFSPLIWLRLRRL